MRSAPGDQEGFCWTPSSRTNTVNQVQFSDMKVQDTFISFCPNKWIGVLFVTVWLMSSVLFWAPFNHRVKVGSVGWCGTVGLKPAPPNVVMLLCLGGWAVVHLVASLQTSYWEGLLATGVEMEHWCSPGTSHGYCDRRLPSHAWWREMDKGQHNAFYQGMQEPGFLLLWMTFASLSI